MKIKNSFDKNFYITLILVLLAIIVYLLFIIQNNCSEGFQNKKSDCPEGTKWCEKCQKCLVETCAEKEAQK